MNVTKKEKAQIKKQIAEFKKEYPNVELASIIPGDDGQFKMVFRPKLATLSPYELAGVDVPEELKAKFNLKTKGSVIYKDYLKRSDLDLANPDIVNESPKKIYETMRSYYRSKDIFGTYIDVMVNLAIAGFENDCEDLKIKEFYDNWCMDIDIEQVLEWIFQEFYTTGFVRTYKVVGKYEPQVNQLKYIEDPPKPKLPVKVKGETRQVYDKMKALWEEGSVLNRLPKETDKEYAERKKRWSKGYIPLAYTVLNPTEIEVVGSVFLNQTRIVLMPTPEMEELIKKEEIQGPLTDSEKNILDSIPPEIKTAIKTGDPVELDPDFVGEADYRRMPWEKYSMPPLARALEVVEYKEKLREADYSTIDGITSEILVITVGDKDNPVLDDDDLRKVAQLFNTPQKAYSVVWNHTLKVERLEIQNIDKIFGPAKFQQAETDMSGSVGMPRALLDGVMIGSTSKEALTLSTKTVVAALKYARRQVERWLYREYKQIAEAFEFNRFPSVRWDDMVLKDELAMKTLIQGMVDRRIISYHTAHKLLGFDPEFEKKQLTKEKDDVVAGNFGILGSPYQKGAGGGESQPTQKTPEGTPSEGRPKNEPAPVTPKPAKPGAPTKEIIKREVKHTKEEIRKGNLQILKQMSLDELAELEKMLQFAKLKKVEQLVNLVEETEENLED